MKQYSSATKPAMTPAPLEDNHDAHGCPAIASVCSMCGESFREKDLVEIEWPFFDEPTHKVCYLQYVDEMSSYSDMLHEMRGA